MLHSPRFSRGLSTMLFLRSYRQPTTHNRSQEQTPHRKRSPPAQELIITHKLSRKDISIFKSCVYLNKRFPYTCFTRESIAFPSSKVYYSHQHVPHSDYRRELQENGLRLLAFYEHLVSRVCLFHSIVLHQYHFQSTPRLLNSLYTAYSKLFSSSFSPLSLSFASQYLWVMMRLKRGLRSKTSRSAREAELARRSRTGATEWYWLRNALPFLPDPRP